MTRTKEHVLTVRLPDDLTSVLKNYAFATDTSVSEVVRKALTDYLSNTRTDEVRAAFDRAIKQHEASLDRLKDS